MDFLINSTKSNTPEHKHSNYEIIVYTKGEGTFCSPQKCFPVAPGKIIIVPPGVVHSTVANSSTEKIYISGEFSHLFNLNYPTAISCVSQNELFSLAKMIYNHRFGNSELISSLVDSFAHLLIQNIDFEEKISIAVRNITDKITNEFYDSNLELNTLLKNSGYAPDYIRSQFKKITGKTPIEFLTNVRIHHACYLISVYRNSLLLIDVAEKCGFTDYVYFSKKFKQITGVSPRRFLEAPFA